MSAMPEDYWKIVSPPSADGGQAYSTKQVEAFAIEEEGWLVITVIVKFF